MIETLREFKEIIPFLTGSFTTLLGASLAYWFNTRKERKALIQQKAEEISRLLINMYVSSCVNFSEFLKIKMDILHRSGQIELSYEQKLLIKGLFGQKESRSKDSTIDRTDELSMYANIYAPFLLEHLNKYVDYQEEHFEKFRELVPSIINDNLNKEVLDEIESILSKKSHMIKMMLDKARDLKNYK